MTSQKVACGFSVLACLLWLGVNEATAIASDHPAFLWQLGQPDGDDKEFAMAPSSYQQFKQDAFFVVGRSEIKKEWPYVQPGPVDSWAGGRPHTFFILFGLKAVATNGECRVQIHLVDTHSYANPLLNVSLNGQEQKYQTPPGAGDRSINGQPSEGKLHAITLKYPAGALNAGLNALAITTTSGSWILYDWIGFEAPDGAELTEVTGSTIASASSPPVLVEREGKLMQIVEVSMHNLGEATPGTLQVIGTKTSTNLTLQPGVQTCTLTVPAVEAPSRVHLGLSVSDKKVAEHELVLKPVRKWEVYLLPHSHVDIGYTHVQTDVERAQWKYIEMGIEAARRSARYPVGSRFKWNTEVLWAVDSYLKQATPEKRQAFFDAVKSGWVGLDGLYGNELTGLCRPEELIRLLTFGADLSKRVGVPIESAMITDVPGYTWGMVPAFAQAGLKYFSMGPNGGDRIGHTISARGDKPFWWIGPNGKDKVLVWMTGTGYYRVFQSAQMLENYLEGLETKGYPYDLVQVRHCLGDNGAPDVDFADTVKAWNSTYAYPRLIIATTAEMFRAFERRYGEKLPVAKGDFTPYWEDGAASSARETALNRASADRLSQAEALFAMLAPKEYPAESFYQAWRNVVLYDEHTWGAHNSISQPDEPFVKSQWAIKQANALDADRQSRELLSRAGSRGGSDVVAGAVDVFNTCSWPRTDLVTLPPALAMDGDRVEDAKGKRLRSQRLSTGELVFVANSVPPFGSKRFFVKPGACYGPVLVKVEPPALNSPEFSVRIDARSGAIDSLVSRSLNKELVDVSGGALNTYLYLPGKALKDIKGSGSVKISIKESGPVLSSLLVESDAPGCKKLTREVRLVAGLPRVEIINTVDKLPIRTKEGLHFGFSFNVPGGHMQMDVPWAVVRPEVDQIAGSCKNWFTVQRWVDISNQKFGVTWATPDAPLVEVGAITANLIGSLSDPAAWLDKVEPSQKIYSWAMNNHWHTNYRAEQEGPTVFRYYLQPHKAAGPDEAARYGIAAAQPLLAFSARGKTPKGPFVTIDSTGVLVSTLKPSEDRQALILRLFSASGKAARVHLKWLASPTRVFLSNAAETPTSTVSGPVEVPGYGLVTLRAELP